MTLNWIDNKSCETPVGVVGERDEYIVHSAQSAASEDVVVRKDIDACVLKAAQLMGDNISDDSLYLLLGWDMPTSTLTAVVTDDSKKKDSIHVVTCTFTGLDLSSDQDKDDYASTVRYWITDYLTTSSEFMKYSLVAAFYRESRAQVELL